MKNQKRNIEKLKAVLLAGFFLGNAGLTGCGNREAEFLEEYKADAGAEEPESGLFPTVTVPIEPSPTEAPIYVDVCGAVANPGVYELAAGSRVFAAVEAAGGYLSQAASHYLNQARPLADGQQIYVPTEEELLAGEEALAAEAPEAFSGKEASGEGQQEASSSKINLNTADETELSVLPGIGPSKARAIVAYREAKGGFSSAEEIMNVEGIKEGTFSKIKDEIVVE